MQQIQPHKRFRITISIDGSAYYSIVVYVAYSILVDVAYSIQVYVVYSIVVYVAYSRVENKRGRPFLSTNQDRVRFNVVNYTPLQTHVSRINASRQ